MDSDVGGARARPASAAPDRGPITCSTPFLQAAIQSRAWVLGFAADNGMPVFTSHFAGSSVGRIRRVRSGFQWSVM
jgi:hypothetical protein